MIPRASITAWRRHAPWASDAQVEQDLVLSRALIELFRQTEIARSVVFRGGTALHKLYFDPPGRYSEDIDLVQREAGPIGSLVEAIRAVLDPWLGEPKWKAGTDRFTLTYRFTTTFEPVVAMRLKIEINTREHFTVHGFTVRRLAIGNPWFSGHADIVTYGLPELLGTKLRALYQRKKGRDLFDLALALDHANFDASMLLQAFERYTAFSGTRIRRAQFEANMDAKLSDAGFREDVRSLLRTGIVYEPVSAWERVHESLVARLPGEPWRGSEG